MKVEIDIDESWALFSVIVQRVVEEAGLSDEDRANVRRWRSEEMRTNSDAFKALTQKLNDDLARALRSKERSQIQKHDWV